MIVDWFQFVEEKRVGSMVFSEVNSKEKRDLTFYNCDWPKVILQKSNFRPANHSSKPPFTNPINSRNFQRFAIIGIFFLSILSKILKELAVLAFHMEKGVS
jgi:hypothetical protein